MQVWDQRASTIGVCFLVICLLGAAGYKQAPLAEPTEPGDSTIESGGTRRRACRKKFALGGVVVVVGCMTFAGIMLQPAVQVSVPPAPAPLLPNPPPQSAMTRLAVGNTIKSSAAGHISHHGGGHGSHHSSHHGSPAAGHARVTGMAAGSVEHDGDTRPLAAHKGAQAATPDAPVTKAKHDGKSGLRKTQHNRAESSAKTSAKAESKPRNIKNGA